MRRFEDDRYYATVAPELGVLGTRDALAQLRSRGVGPRYHKVGRRILYRGSDLNRYLDECVIEPTSRRRRNRLAAVGQGAESVASPA